MSRLATRYLGLSLRSPIVASAGPVTGRLDLLERLDKAGVGAVVLPSLFEEELTNTATELNHMFDVHSLTNPEAASFFPELEDFRAAPDAYLGLLKSAKESLGVPVIASLNGATMGGWETYAAELEAAGADAIELNIYLVAADVSRDPTEIEKTYISIVEGVRREVSIPLAVKLSPYFTAVGHFATSVTSAGANGLVLFNRFYQPDINTETREVTPGLSLSTSAEMRLPLRWIAVLFGKIDASLALTTGVHTSDDVAKALLAGADVVMSTSSLIENGPEHVGALEQGLLAWMDEHEYESVEQLRGSASQMSAADPSAFERANYVETLRRYSSSFARRFGV
ncbi:MAG: dihydroorotate dehydrogenase-like protein [Acidobacteria bacterium]|nr:MAG: dihydroorotate dehydrogenase-like protein [Acidobacteriota bacterium]